MKNLLLKINQLILSLLSFKQLTFGHNKLKSFQSGNQFFYTNSLFVPQNLSFFYSMGNINNTHIEYWTKSGHKISYLFWDLKGKNRFPQQPSDIQITIMFNKCLQEIDISSYQLKAIQEFTPKYKYRFVVLHKRKVQQATKEQQIKKFSRDSFHIHYVQQVKTMQSQKKIEQLEKLFVKIQLNESSIKSSLMNLQKFISDTLAQNEFIQIRGIQRILSHLQTASKMNQKGTKTSFSSQVELLKFLRIFSDRFMKEFYSYLPQVRSYAMAILQSYHPINTQIIAYGLSLLSDFAWRVELQRQEDSLIQTLEKYKKEKNLQSFLSPFIESIIESDSIVNVYHNFKFINELMASVAGKKDKDLLEQNLIKTKYSVVLENVKLKLETMHYSIEKTTFISVYQKIFKYSLAKQGLLKQRPNIDTIIQENYRNSVLANHRNTLQGLHQQAIVTLIQVESQLASQECIQDSQPNQLVTYLNENDRRQFNKLIFDALTEMQKYYKLQFYLQTTSIQNNQESSIDTDYQKAKQLIESRITEHNVQTHFNKIKLQCTQNKTIEIFNSCLQKIQAFQFQQWKQLEKWLYQGNQENKILQKQVQQLKSELEEKKNKIKSLIKENNQLKNTNPERKNSQHVDSTQSNLLKPPPSLQESLKNTTLNSMSTNSSLVIPPILPPPPLPVGLPSIPILNLSLSFKQKPKRQPPKPLKACNYTTITYERIKNSVFEEIDDSKIEIDENELVDLFAKNVQSQNKMKRTASLQTIVSIAESRRLTLPGSVIQTVQLLRPDRAKNIQIVLAKLKIPKGEFKKALTECNGGKYLSQSTLEAIQKILPTEEEQQLISSFQGNENDLGVSQRFLKELIEVPEYTSRIKAILFSHIHEQLYHEIQSKISQLSIGFTSLRYSSRLKCVIQNSLAIGNYLNGQSVKGGAWGFRLQTIQRLQEVKSSDGKMNGALYLIKQLWKHFDYPLFQRQELQLYQYLAKMPLSQVKHQVDELQSYVNAIDKACKSKDQTNQKDKIVTFCSIFQQQASQQLTEFRNKFTELKQVFSKCASFYCEESKTLSSDQFGKKMYQCILFVSNTQKIYKVINQQNIKTSKFKATQKSISYRQSSSPQKLRESMINIREDNMDAQNQKQNLSKTTALILETAKKGQQRLSFKKKQSDRNSIMKEPEIMIPITHNQRASHRLSYIFEIHKPTKPLQQLSQQEIQTELKAIQRQSVNRAMEDVFRRRTIKFQNINARFSKVNVTPGNDNKVQVESRISFLKNIEPQKNTIIQQEH